MNKRRLGKEQEAVAIAKLIECGYQILETNFWCHQGEIDVIAKDGGYYAFIEVKYRKSTNQGHPSEAMSYHKRQTITRTARYFMYKNKISEDEPCRFDVVSILGDEVTIIKNAFEVQDEAYS